MGYKGDTVYCVSEHIVRGVIFLTGYIIVFSNILVCYRCLMFLVVIVVV